MAQSTRTARTRSDYLQLPASNGRLADGGVCRMSLAENEVEHDRGERSTGLEGVLHDQVVALEREAHALLDERAKRVETRSSGGPSGPASASAHQPSGSRW